MDYVNLGRTGLQVSRLCLGCMTYGDPSRGYHPWVLNEAQSRPLIKQAVEAGINFFDTANIYAGGTSEEIVGRALKDMTRRDETVIATKLHGPMGKGPNMAGLSRKAVFQAIDASLTRLGTDYIDLYQIHRADPKTPIEETLDALNDVVRAGKVRYIGASSMFAWQFAKAIYISRANGWAEFVSMQNYLNLLNREEEREMIPLCIDQGVAVIPWSPLARGRLTRPWDEKTERFESDAFGKTLYATTMENDRQIVDMVSAIANERGVPRAQVALAWVLQKPGITAPIIGATKAHHLPDALAALALRLSDGETMRLESAYAPHPVVGFA